MQFHFSNIKICHFQAFFAIMCGLSAAPKGNFTVCARKSIVFTCKKVDHPRKVNKVNTD